MSNFRRLRRGNKPVDQSWLRAVVELSDTGVETDLNPKPFVGKLNKSKAIRLLVRREKQKARRNATI